MNSCLPPPGPPKRRGFRRVAFPFLVVLLAVFSTLLLLEIGIRIFKGEARLVSFWSQQHLLLKSAQLVQFHPRLGWIPRAGASGKNNYWGTEVTIGSEGLRSNGESSPLPAKQGETTILTVGDSFTFGDEVSDTETWPAQLQQLSGIRVLNGGVSGYGLDQAVLRLDSLLISHSADAIILGITLPELSRCEFSVCFSATKPFFQPSPSGLELRLEHIRSPSLGETRLRRILGHSLFIHEFMNLAFPSYWRAGAWTNTRAHHVGSKVVCRIFDSLGSFMDRHPRVKRLYLLVQYLERTSPAQMAILDGLLACVRDHRVKVIDLRKPLQELQSGNPEGYRKLFRGHMTPAGNRFTAEWIVRALGDDSKTLAPDPSVLTGAHRD